ncbi:phage tail length tape measure family protein [Chelativorans sp.]|uniref:phage tail tape measure protein n=1 Tax=Chelativorans sp. TaxID=2203393 RepID=UPI002812543F|nr:phage tail length tape measure family protein [Chelativorans sp.]
MADLATLGIAVDSSQAERGAISLQKLSGAARMAEQATKGTASGARAAAQANAVVASSADVAAASLTRQAGAARQAAVAVNDNMRRMGGGFSGLAAQVQDIGITAAMGMNPMIIALQQGTQIAGQMEAAMQNGGSAAGVFRQALLSLLSPVSLLAIGLTALLAAGLQMVDWPAAAAWALDMLAGALETVAPYAVAAAGALALIYAPSIVTGLVSLIALIARVGVAALAAAGSFTAAWLAAMGPVGWLVTALAAVGAAAYLLRDEIKQAIGVDVVAIMKGAGNFILSSFEVVYSEMKFLWATFPEIIAVAVFSAVDFLISGVNNMVRAAAAGIDELISYANKIPGVKLEPIGDPGDLISPIGDGGAGARLGAANRNQAAEYERIMAQDRLGQFGAAIGEGASAASEKLRELATWMTTVDEKGKKKRGAKTEAEKYQDVVDGANRRIATLRAEQEALGLTEFEAAKLRYETDLLNEAQQKGITLTEGQRAALSALAGTMAGVEVATERVKEAMAFAKDLTRGFINDLQSGLEQGKGFWESFGNAALNVLNKITDKLLGDVLDAIFRVSNAGGGGGGGIFGWLGKLLGFGGGGYSPAASSVLAGGGAGLYANGAAFNRGNVIPFAAGGIVTSPTVFPMAKGIGLMGEAGPEAIMPLRRTPDGRLGVEARGAVNDAPQRVSINVNVSGARGNTEIRDMVAEGVQQGLTQYDREVLPRRWSQIARDPNAVG